MTKELVPEMHDIGKLQNKYEHNFEDVKTDINTQTWHGIKEHHCQMPRLGRERVLQEYPKCIETFLLCIADNLASAVSRPPKGKGPAIYNVYKLWNPPHETIPVPPIKTDSGVQEIIKFVATNPSASEFFEKYNILLRDRAEDSHPGANITSLETHSRLTGQFYRILTSIEDKQIESGDITGKGKESISNLMNKVQNTWKLTILKCKIHFPQSPVRAKDMNVFKVLGDFVEELKDEFQDNVMFSTSDELLFVAPVNSNVLEQIKTRAKEVGFWLDIRQEDQLIGRLNLEEVRKPSTEYPSIHSRLDPPICEVCQMAAAMPESAWMDEDSGIEEKLCEKCYKIRKMGVFFTKLKEWGEENPRVAYIKIKLDMDELVKTLNGLYARYLMRVGVPNASEKAEIRFSVLSEFQRDYDEFLSALEDIIVSEYGEGRVQQILKGFLCVKLGNTSEIRKILEIYDDLLDKYFPEFKGIKSPLKLSITCANVKFPFIWNWKILDNPKDAVNVSLIDRGEMNLKVKQIEDLLSTRLPSKKILIDLSKTAEISKKLAWIMLTDKGNRRTYGEFEGLRKAITSSGIDYESILVFAKMISD